jgi:glycosyltransferase involved in cell wall biosynthesis
MRICLYTSTALPKMGGQEIAVDALARQFQIQGHEVVVLAPHPRLPLRARDGELPYRVVRHPRLYSTRRFVDWYAWWLVRLHRKDRFDIVHCHGVYPHGYLGTRLRQRLGAPVVVTSHGDDVVADNHRMRCPVIGPRIRQAVQTADHLIAISSFTREGYLQLGADPVRITDIPNGADSDQLSQRTARPGDLPAGIRSGEYVLFLGRLAPRKGVDVLLAAMSRMPATGGVELVIAGTGEERETLEGLCRSLELNGRVYFAGAVGGEKKSYLLQNARCLVVPSRLWEGCPLVVLEAFATGIPVLGSQLKGMADFIKPDRTGWLVPPEDAAALAEALMPVRSSRITAEMKEEIRKAAAELSWPAIARRQIELFETLVSRRHAERGGWSGQRERHDGRRSTTGRP